MEFANFYRLQAPAVQWDALVDKASQAIDDGRHRDCLRGVDRGKHFRAGACEIECGVCLKVT